MYKDKKIGVVVPAYNEEKFIAGVLNGVPALVDRIYAVNDASTDNTLAIIKDVAKRNNRVVLIDRKKNGGVGASIISGHKRALQDDIDVIAIMAGDGQMDPEILKAMLQPVVEGKADYAKGNRLSKKEHRQEMPLFRRFGNFLLTALTRIASGYWHISDPQNGYTAISRVILRKLDLDRIVTGFAFENDMLVKLNVAGARVVDIPHAAVYRGQKSKIRYSKFILHTSWVLLKDFFWRVWMKTTRRDLQADLSHA